MTKTNPRIRSAYTRHVQSPACGPNVALEKTLIAPRGLIHKMNRMRPAASIVVKCSPTDIPLTTCVPLGKNFGHPWRKPVYSWPESWPERQYVLSPPQIISLVGLRLWPFHVVYLVFLSKILSREKI